MGGGGCRGQTPRTALALALAGDLEEQSLSIHMYLTSDDYKMEFKLWVKLKYLGYVCWCAVQHWHEPITVESARKCHFPRFDPFSLCGLTWFRLNCHESLCRLYNFSLEFPVRSLHYCNIPPRLPDQPSLRDITGGFWWGNKSRTCHNNRNTKLYLQDQVMSSLSLPPPPPPPPLPT